MAYIGREPQIGNYQVCDAISVVNGQAAYTMQVSSVDVIPESVNHMIVSLNGVIQNPGSSYTISSSTITFSSNLATGDSIDFIYLLGNTLDLGTPSDSTVTSAKLSGNLVTPGTLDVNGQELILDADADTSITADTDDQIDIKVAGADDFQITANTLTALSGSTIKADTIAETTSANGVAVDGLTIKDGKLNTNDSVVTANITDANVTSAKIAGDAITAAKIADDAISEEHLDATVITGMTELAAEPADTDEFLISDAGTLKRIDYSHIKGGGSWVKISTVTASNSSSVDFDNVANTYKVYAVIGVGIRPATDNVKMEMNFGSDGNTYAASKTSAFVHQYNKNNDTDLQNEVNGTNSLGSGTGNQELGYGLSDNVAMSGSNTLNAIFGGLAQGNYSSYDVKFTHFASNSYMYSSTVRGIIAADVDCIRFILSSGNIAAGTFTLYGIDQ